MWVFVGFHHILYDHYQHDLHPQKACQPLKAPSGQVLPHLQAKDKLLSKQVFQVRPFVIKPSQDYLPTSSSIKT